MIFMLDQPKAAALNLALGGHDLAASSLSVGWLNMSRFAHGAILKHGYSYASAAWFLPRDSMFSFYPFLSRFSFPGPRGSTAPR
jgi:hypothetical protein